MSTHKIFANNILEKVDSEKTKLIDKKKFIWGNIKPDYVSKYKLKKHFYDESVEMIIEKINFLSTLSVEDIYGSYGRKKFSAELGVVCHFLCDFFCLAHSERWRLKSDLKRHVCYEQRLAKIAKEYEFSTVIDEGLVITDIEQFITQNIREYEKSNGLYKDLEYSSFVCNSIINALLSQVINNEYIERRVG